MNDRYGTPPMFEQIPDTRDGYGPVSYARYRPKKPRKCDDCLAALGRDPKAPATRTAAFKRVQQGTADLLLCYPHKEKRREREAR